MASLCHNNYKRVSLMFLFLISYQVPFLLSLVTKYKIWAVHLSRQGHYLPIICLMVSSPYQSK